MTLSGKTLSPLKYAVFGFEGFDTAYLKEPEKHITHIYNRAQRDPKMAKYKDYTREQIAMLFYNSPKICNKDTLDWLFDRGFTFKFLNLKFGKDYIFVKEEFALIEIDENNNCLFEDTESEVLN